MAEGIKVRQAVAHEVRVRARGVRLTPDGKGVQVSTRSDFIAPDLSAPSTLAIELDKGLAGWTRDDVKPATVTPVFPKHEDDYAVGTAVIRKPVAEMRVISRTGPRRNRRK